ncbi:MauE/DoxX family redox-associated membrane protein [Streptomyces sp. NPDC091271]|uniref:MauE/DoxX family redox-associated membrane protein n=1 Tax=Streptomyces sp. NPDC091271 TaxID=3365980 RepID=UPI00381719C9
MLLVNAGVAAVFLRSAAAKAVSPGVAAAAVHELLGGRLRPADNVVRLVALIEVVTVVLLVAPGARAVAHVITGVLGLLFIVMGTAGKVRGSDRPCGCFGIADSKPLGTANIVSGLVFAAVAVIGLAWPASDGHGGAAETAVLASAVSSGWLLFTHRHATRTAYRNFLRRWGSA